MASVAKIITAEGQTRYRVRYRVGERQVEKWAKSRTIALAMKRKDRVRRARRAADRSEVGAEPLGQYAEQRLVSRIVKGRPLAESTVAAYRGQLHRNILPTLGAMPLRSLHKDQIRSWYGQVAIDVSRDQAAKSYRLLHAILVTGRRPSRSATT